MDELVTVIIPVYNKCSQIARCVASVTGQTHTLLRIVLIDDGSTDGSGELCDELAREDARVVVVHQENGGVAAARNAGLGQARGAWIAFVDADDYISPYYIEDLLDAARDGYDMALCRAAWVQDSDRETNAPFRRASRTEAIAGREACVRHFANHALYNSLWGKLYRAELWENLLFKEGMISEDLFLSHALLYRAKRIVILDAVLYAYVQSAESIMRSAFSPVRLDALDAWEEGVRFFTAVDEPDIARIAKRVYCSRVFDAQWICREKIPQARDIHRQLYLRGKEAYREVRGFYRYADCSTFKALGYRLMFLLGRWCPSLYGRLFVRGRWRNYL